MEGTSPKARALVLAATACPILVAGCALIVWVALSSPPPEAPFQNPEANRRALMQDAASRPSARVSSTATTPRARTASASASAERPDTSPPRHRPTEDAVATSEQLAQAWVWPAGSLWITSPFGRRADPMYRASAHHNGVDVRADFGSKVVAAAEGTVVFAGRSQRGGQLVRVAHANDQVTVYAHLSKIEVAEGQHVEEGQEIARSGASGRVTGPHLHFEMWENGRPLNPLEHLWKAAPQALPEGALAQVE